MLASTTLAAQQSNKHFSHTLQTTARPETIWRIWIDVPNWKNWDDGLREAQLNGSFEVGTKGTLIPDKGQKAKFQITALVPGQSYTFKTKLPLGALHVRRTLKIEGGNTLFTHEVWFTGLTKGIFARVLGRKYRAILPSVMDKINVIATK